MMFLNPFVFFIFNRGEIVIDMIIEHKGCDHSTLCEKYGSMTMIALTSLLLCVIVYLNPVSRL